jgi:hypothetical protein
LGEQRLGHAAENPFTQSSVSVRARDDQVSRFILDEAKQAVGGCAFDRPYAFSDRGSDAMSDQILCNIAKPVLDAICTKRTCYCLYRRIVPINRNASGQLALDGDGEVIEWAVEMVRFDDTQTLDRFADAGGIDDTLAQKLAAVVAAMHERVPVVDASSWIVAIKDFLDQNMARFKSLPRYFKPILQQSKIGSRAPSSNACGPCSPAVVSAV